MPVAARLLSRVFGQPLEVAGARLRGLRLLLFLREVALLAITCVGGPQTHLAIFNRQLVQRRKYITSEELLELHALCQMLPGPTSTQTLTAVAFRLGGPNVAYLALLIWVLPSVLVMAGLAMLVADAEARQLPLSFTRFVEPVAVGLVAQAAFQFAQRTILGNLDAGLMVGAALITYYLPSPYLSPVLLAAGGAVTAWRFRARQPWQEKQPMQIDWANFLLWVGVFIVAALAGRFTHWLPVRLFENFYRNGSLIFGGGQVLIPLMFTEFVTFKHYLTQDEFLLGYALVQTLPGPIFAFCAYVGALSARHMGWGGTWAGAGAATLGIFLPGTFLIFFIIRFWQQLKRYRVVKASLEGINAVSAGLIFAAAMLMFKPVEASGVNIGVIAATFLILHFSKLPAWVLIAGSIVMGFFIKV